MEIKLRPFRTPNFVIIPETYGRSTDSIPLCDVPAKDLSDLCDQFRSEIFRKAGKKDPREGR